LQKASLISDLLHASVIQTMPIGQPQVTVITQQQPPMMQPVAMAQPLPAYQRMYYVLL